ncbi:MAG TPA: type II toxin-antitoxin system VapC family toxin [Casimicrobiaceae bacterium]|nr:type II toxin-antitoxin system VapC family toxin [Casimicrobiaceae bacterium]
MIGLDTNVLVRYLVRDDDAQFAIARRLIEQQDADTEWAFVSLMVLLETEWVLRSRYRLGKDVVVDAITRLLHSADVKFEDEDTVEEALFQWNEARADFADCLIGARNRRLGCRATATFDSSATRPPTFVDISQCITN